MAHAPTHTADSVMHDGETRRDFLTLATATFGTVGVAAAIWPLIDQMNPARDVLAVRTTEVDLAPIAVGQRVTVMWQGKPTFIVHRTPEQIEAARSVDLEALPDPQADAERAKRAEWLVLVGICTHLGCIPLGQKPNDASIKEVKEFGGWFCPCHGSVYDASGRIRRGPAPRNLEVPPYEFLDNNVLRIG